jgi:16S rRNA (cytosine1402-N4)-methyltransferase
MSKTHLPVLAPELVEIVNPGPGEVAVDCTFGGGGHARLVAERLGPQGALVCIDRDPAAQERFEEFSQDIPCQARFLRTNFADGLELLAAEGFSCDVAYLDLGVSSMQIDAWERGFSYAYDAPLDMRMDPTQDLDARGVINTWDERRLAKTFQVYGEERYSKQIARALCERRDRFPIETTHDLVETIKLAIPDPARFAGGHPARRVFQAIRIAVNGELDSLDRALPLVWSLLRPGGRLGAISFHSLEDRRVKRFCSQRARGCVCPPEFPVCVCNRNPEAELLTRRGVVPGAQEMADNPRSRSARLRAARKLASEEGA